MASNTRTKIVATLGPASWDPETIEALILAGVDVVRINGSHTDGEGIRRQVARVRRASAQLGRPVAVLLDLQGPKIRTADIDPPLPLAVGDLLQIAVAEEPWVSGLRVGTTYEGLARDVRLGDRVLFADGALAGRVESVDHEATPSVVSVRIDEGGLLGSHKGINLPGVEVSAPSLSEKDLADLAVAVEVAVDYVAQSFVRRADDVIDLRRRLEALGCDAPIIAKIEKPEALDNLDAILDVADGVMVARGDLGVEVPLPTVPVLQKRILAAAARKGKLAITATQMLDSMERNPRPTRAETTDVANAIFDGTDAVMLSGETSVGRYPLESVRTMDAIARAAEASPFLHTTFIRDLPPLDGPAGAACRAACWALSEAPRPLIVFTHSGATARFMSRLRARGPIFAMSSNPRVVDAMALVWGVTPILLPVVHGIEEMTEAAERLLLHLGHVQPGDELVVLGGNHPRQESAAFLKFHVCGR